MKKVRVGVLFGGRSGEHEVSLASARSVLAAIDRDKYEPVPIGITRAGQWLIVDAPDMLLASEVRPELSKADEAVPDVSHHGIIRAAPGGGLIQHETAVDVVFPLLHGPYGEDGTVQGLLEMADLPYVGAGVLSSAISMDKVYMKKLFEAAGIPGVSYQVVMRRDFQRMPGEVIDRVESALTYPMFVKPANLGSSVGISKVHHSEELHHALAVAARYDRRIIVEQGINAREIECSVMGNDDPMVSVPGEVLSRHEWYDYESKYTEGLAELRIPASVTGEQTKRAQELARRAFIEVDAAGLARVDFFVRRSDGEVLVNEINTMPGFTSTSMYPKLWEASGVPYTELIDRLIQLALERHAETRSRSVNR